MKREQPYVTYAITAVCAAVFAIVQFIHAGSSVENGIVMGAYYKPMIMAGEYWRMITVGFVHTEPVHIMVNMVSLINAGTVMETVFGHKRYAAVLTGSILCGSLAVYTLTDTAAAVGLSGGLYGLMGAYFWLMIRRGALKDARFRYSLIRMAVINLSISLMPGVSMAAHLGGLAGGILITVWMSRRRMTEKQKMILAASSAVLAGLCVFGVIRGSSVDQEHIYLGTDYRVLLYEKEHGLEKHALKTAEKLDTIYADNGLLVQMLGEE